MCINLKHKLLIKIKHNYLLLRRNIMQLSARNQFKGKVVEITKGAVNSIVKIDIGGNVISSSITNEAVEQLKLQEGKEAYAIIKASNVMVGID